MSQGADPILRVARRLGPLADHVVFLGGAAVPLLVTDPGAAPPRPTKDVDVAIEVASRAEYSGKLRDSLHALGFREDTEEGAPVCRWVIEDLKVDIMPANERVLGFSNRWYSAALASRVRHVVPGRGSIWLASAPCLLATKLEAFRDRGEDDYRASHDLEDFLAVVDGRPGIEAECSAADPDVHRYIQHELIELLDEPRFIAALPGHLPADAGSQARVPALRARLERLAGRQRES